MTTKKTMDDLTGEALDNAREDRERAKEIFAKIKGVFEIDPTDPSTLNSAMLMGGQVVDVLEQLTRSNEQIVRLAQIKEREESKEKAKNKDGKFTMQDVVEEFEKTKKDETEVH